MSQEKHPSAGEAAADVVTQLDALFAPFNRSDSPGLVVGIARRGRSLYRRGFGLASVSQGLANSPATRMRIGSTTKHFTCLAAMLLHEEGKLDVDAPVTALLPKFKSPQAIPTLRQFMNHTSGMRCSLELSMMSAGLAMAPKGWQERRLYAQQDVNFLPNHGQMYCNGGYHLLSRAIDHAAGMPFEQFLQERVLRPLGMHDSECLPSDFRLLPRLATLHLPTPDGGWQIGTMPSEEIRGEGSLVSTVDDMLRWLAHLNGPKRVGSEATWREMLTPPVLESGHRSVYGLGLYVHDYRGVRVIHHAGGVIGGNSQMITVPEHGLDIAIMVNGAACNATDTAWQIIDLLLADVLKPAARSLAAYDEFKHLDGQRYHGSSGTLLAFGKVKEDRLGLSLNHTVPLPILHDEGEALAANFEDIALGPLRIPREQLRAGPDGRAPQRLTWYECGVAEELERVDEQASSTAELAKELVGRYRMPDIGGEASIRLDGELLLLELRGDYGSGRRLRLEGWSPTALTASDIDLPGAGFAVTLERAGKQLRRLRLDSTRCRHIALERIE